MMTKWIQINTKSLAIIGILLIAVCRLLFKIWKWINGFKKVPSEIDSVYSTFSLKMLCTKLVRMYWTFFLNVQKSNDFIEGKGSLGNFGFSRNYSKKIKKFGKMTFKLYQIDSSSFIEWKIINYLNLKFFFLDYIVKKKHNLKQNYWLIYNINNCDFISKVDSSYFVHLVVQKM